MPIKRNILPFILGFLVGVLFIGFLLIYINHQKLQQNVFIKTLVSTQSITDIIVSTQSADNAGLIDINTADEEILDTLSGIGPQKASSIVDFRNKYGNFQSIDELLFVPGISNKLYNSIKDKIYIGE